MIQKKDILEALRKTVEKAMPGLAAVYVNVAPEVSERPSALIRLTRRTVLSAGAALLNVEQLIRIELTGAAPESQNTGDGTLTTLSDEAEALLAAGYVTAAGRRLAVTKIRSYRIEETAAVTATLSYCDDRPSLGEDAEQMKNIHLNETLTEE